MLGTTIYATVLALLTVLTIKRPHVGVVGLLIMFGLEQLGQLYIPFLRAHGVFTNLYILVLLIGAVGLIYRAGQFTAPLTYRENKAAYLSTALYLFALLSFVWSPVDPSVYWRSLWPYVVANIILAPLLIVRIGDLEQVQKVFIWMGGVLILFLGTVPDWGTRSLIISDIEEDLKLPLGLAQMSGYLLIIATIHFKKTFLSIAWLSCVIVAALLVAIKTGSRGQVIFSILSILLVTPLLWNRISLKNILQLSVTGGLIVLIGFLIFQETDAFTSRWESRRLISDLLIRVGLVKALLSEWINSPLAILFGLGNSASFSNELVGKYTHIVPLEILGEEGLVGLVLFAAIILVVTQQARRISALALLSKDVRRVYAANYGCFIFTLLLSLKQGSLINSSTIFLFAVLSEKYFNLVRRELRHGVELTRDQKLSRKSTGRNARHPALYQELDPP